MIMPMPTITYTDETSYTYTHGNLYATSGNVTKKYHGQVIHGVPDTSRVPHLRYSQSWHLIVDLKTPKCFGIHFYNGVGEYISHKVLLMVDGQFFPDTMWCVPQGPDGEAEIIKIMLKCGFLLPDIIDAISADAEWREIFSYPEIA